VFNCKRECLVKYEFSDGSFETAVEGKKDRGSQPGLKAVGEDGIFAKSVGEDRDGHAVRLRPDVKVGPVELFGASVGEAGSLKAWVVEVVGFAMLQRLGMAPHGGPAEFTVCGRKMLVQFTAPVPVGSFRPLNGGKFKDVLANAVPTQLVRIVTGVGCLNDVRDENLVFGEGAVFEHAPRKGARVLGQRVASALSQGGLALTSASSGGPRIRQPFPVRQPAAASGSAASRVAGRVGPTKPPTGSPGSTGSSSGKDSEERVVAAAVAPRDRTADVTLTGPGQVKILDVKAACARLTWERLTRAPMVGTGFADPGEAIRELIVGDAEFWTNPSLMSAATLVAFEQLKIQLETAGHAVSADGKDFPIARALEGLVLAVVAGLKSVTIDPDKAKLYAAFVRLRCSVLEGKASHLKREDLLSGGRPKEWGNWDGRGRAGGSG
jgi:hypothetical protein